MFSRSTWVHLRLPFSWVLAPVFFFAAAETGSYFTRGFWVAAVVQFLLLYPASHAFNSFFDRDVGSIGGIKNPPRVGAGLLSAALLLDALALGAALWVGLDYFGMVLVYGLASKAYSHPLTRWKARPWWGWAVVTFFQGAFSFAMSARAMVGAWPSGPAFWGAAAIASVWIGSSYPLTQIYQHEEDARRGDRTLSLWLGTHGTLVFSALGFAAAQGLLGLWAWAFHRAGLFWAVQLGFAPSAAYFLAWARRGDFTRFESVMRMTWLSSTGVNLALIAYGFFSRS